MIKFHSQCLSHHPYMINLKIGCCKGEDGYIQSDESSPATVTAFRLPKVYDPLRFSTTLVWVNRKPLASEVVVIAEISWMLWSLFCNISSYIITEYEKIYIHSWAWCILWAQQFLIIKSITICGKTNSWITEEHFWISVNQLQQNSCSYSEFYGTKEKTSLCP
jgi:hypothetical protein